MEGRRQSEFGLRLPQETIVYAMRWIFLCMACEFGVEDCKCLSSRGLLSGMWPRQMILKSREARFPTVPSLTFGSRDNNTFPIEIAKKTVSL